MKTRLSFRALVRLQALAAVVPLGGALVFLHWDFVHQRGREAERLLAEGAAALARDVDAYLNAGIAPLLRLDRSRIDEAIRLGRCTPALDGAGWHFPTQIQLLVVGPGGQLACETGSGNPGRIPVTALADVAEVRMPDSVVTLPARAELDGTWTTMIVRRWAGPDGSPGPAVVLRLHFSRIQEMVANAPERRGTVATLVDQTDRILARSRDPDRFVGTVVRSPLRPGPRGTRQIRGPDGTERIVALAPVPATGWLVAVGFPADYEDPGARSAAIGLGLLLIGVLGVAAATAGGVARRIERPIGAIGAAMERVAAGDLSIAVPTDGPKELAALAERLNQLIAARREAELARERVVDELRSLAAATEGARERERTRVARDLHDDLGQSLTALALQLAACEAESDPRDLGFSRHAGEMRKLLGHAHDQVRRIAQELRPAALDRLGLAPALRWLVREFATRTGIATELVVDELPPLGDAARTAIYRIAQEALTNVYRHAAAAKAQVSLYTVDADLVLEIEDDGSGTAQSADGESGTGFRGMAERIRPWGGRLDQGVGELGGFRLTIRLPRERIQEAE